jgi:hypothetical protein
MRLRVRAAGPREDRRELGVLDPIEQIPALEQTTRRVEAHEPGAVGPSGRRVRGQHEELMLERIEIGPTAEQRGEHMRVEAGFGALGSRGGGIHGPSSHRPGTAFP